MQTDNVLNKLRLNHLNKEETKVIKDLCLQYKDVCYDERLPLTFTNHVKHRLNMKEETPVYLRPYRKTPLQKEEIKKQVKNLLDQDVIQESCSPWSAPVSIVPKKSDASGDDTEDLRQDIQDILDTENFFEVPQQLIDEVIVPNEDTDTASEAENEEVIETAHSNQTEEPSQSIPSMDEAIDNKNPQ
ncbi:hypothetical protein QE152_g4427 [Popillia japonica]|uniref:Retrovirus-related Pol polyprotein from transposon 297 n=1 Tax=Popillia japonica TaxID=7064 RepID=A0AAW1MVA7_POPJA